MSGRPFSWSTALVMAALLFPSTAQALSVRDSAEATEAFREEIEDFLDTLPLGREKFEVRINRCQAPDGAMRDDVYAVWIGARLVAPGNDAGAVLAELAATWESGGWTLTRNRALDNGGVNIAAIEPRTGSSYILDSGFAIDPTGYAVGYFTTPCFSDPSGAAPFGAVSGR